jgi:hypothetical protein
MVDDIIRYFCETVDICFTATVVSTLYGVVKQTINRVVVVPVILGGIYTTQSGDRMCPTGRITDAENLYVIAEFSQRGGCRSTAKTCADNDYIEFALVGRTYDTDVVFVRCPFLFEGPLGNVRN